MTLVHTARDRQFRPWKNGGGQTAEILAFPEGAGFDDFQWRLSTAIVASDGPFSSFPGIDRVLTVVEGDPMVMTVDGVDIRLQADSAPFAFAGEAQTGARLEAGSLLDFNVMVRRPARAEVIRGPLDPEAAHEGPRFALLLEDGAGFERLDLIDLGQADAELRARLSGLLAVEARIHP